MSATSSLHYQLCCEAAKWLHRRKHDVNKCPSKPCYRGHGFCRACIAFKFVTVELCTYGTEQADVWGFNGTESAVIEVKTTHADFLNDKKKWFRSDVAERCGLQAGAYRWYLCPTDVIKADELPQGWGLLYWDGKQITHVVAPTRFENSWKVDLHFLYSLLLREKFPQKIFNYRGQNTTIKPKTVFDPYKVLNPNEMKSLDSDISHVVSDNLFDLI